MFERNKSGSQEMRQSKFGVGGSCVTFLYFYFLLCQKEYLIGRVVLRRLIGIALIFVVFYKLFHHLLSQLNHFFKIPHVEAEINRFHWFCEVIRHQRFQLIEEVELKIN